MVSITRCSLQARELEPFRKERGLEEKARRIELKWKLLPRSRLTSYPQVGVLKIVPP